MSETNVELFAAEQLNGTEVAASFAYPNGIASGQVEEVVTSTTLTPESAPVAQRAEPNMEDVMKYAYTIGTNMELLRDAA